MTDFEHDGRLWVPRDQSARVEKAGAETVVFDNQSGLPDQIVEDALIENTAAFGWATNTRYMSYQSQGSMLGRAEVYRPPSNVIEEIQMCRDLCERDDDLAPALDAMIRAATCDGFQNQHPDEQVQHTFDEMTEDNQLLRVIQECLREYAITGQLNTAHLFVRGNYEIRPEGVSRVLTRNVAVPLVSVLPAERIRVIGDDSFFNGELAFQPDGDLDRWLRTFFDPTTSAAKKNEMRKQYPVRAAMFTGPIPVGWNDVDLFEQGMTLYRLNPDIVSRTTMPKGDWKYPRPPLTRNLPLLEAKRLLNVMDFSLLQGATNYIILVRKGSDQRPALPAEMTNLQGVVQRASQTGILVGDHRLQVEVVQPDHKELLNPDKRKMLGRKLCMALLRIPELVADETGGAEIFTEMFQNTVGGDRNAVIGHILRNIWRPTMKRNSRTFSGAKRPDIWFPQVVMRGQQWFTDYLLKMYDRGDLPRKFMVEYGGYSYEAVMAQKQREIENGHDEIFTPPPVPFTAPNQQNSPTADPNDQYRYGPTNGPGRGPQDNNPGRPRGSGPNNGRPGATRRSTPNAGRPTRVIRRTPGETVRAYYDDDLETVVRIGELTFAILGEYPECEQGRLTEIERRAVEAGQTMQEGPTIVIPVMDVSDMREVRAVRLGDGASLLTGQTRAGTIYTVGLSFREPQWTLEDAENTALRWGFAIDIVQADFGGPDDDPSNPNAPGDVPCPGCGEMVSTDGNACPECGYDGPPFSSPLPRLSAGQAPVTINLALPEGVTPEQIAEIMRQAQPPKPAEGDPNEGGGE